MKLVTYSESYWHKHQKKKNVFWLWGSRGEGTLQWGTLSVADQQALLPLLPHLLWSLPRRETSILSTQPQAYKINLLPLLFFINICLDLNSRRGLKWAIFDVKTLCEIGYQTSPWNIQEGNSHGMWPACMVLSLRRCSIQTSHQDVCGGSVEFVGRHSFADDWLVLSSHHHLTAEVRGRHCWCWSTWIQVAWF